MSRVPITDLNDPRIAIYRSLKATNQTRRLGQFVVEGEKLVARLLASRFPAVSVLVTDRHEPRLATRIPDAVPTYVVPHELVDSIVGFPFHRGVLACGQSRPWPSLPEIAVHRGPPADRGHLSAIVESRKLGRDRSDRRRLRNRRDRGRAVVPRSFLAPGVASVDGIGPRRSRHRRPENRG